MKLNLRSAEETAGFLARLDIYTPEQIERRIVLDYGVHPDEAHEMVASALSTAREQSLRDEEIVKADREAARAEWKC